ncbi:hypothetical protein [Deinococcus soli (ex Cha et al. 2016)]|uniref:Uncharacterized protein n=1 Tax=Deinococcus soli (ex Cha et al. 2016) TaxID=1309411 RepID=A0A0F7JLY5_9DEIO|nr:hypothetical protein [Deinococcus soli (ex Cha et al. 2016)]AKH15725.1 hypothetical protein SY84_00190 [Deinococcus soli (ex Cha et al. 2016)]GGB52370.1 hypothetical protein GCM10008019_04880 [Deinococcus soli (ex Cha et al. 2016)]
MSSFDELQAVIRRGAQARQAEVQACEGFLTLLYHALRAASGPGLPLNNVSMDPAPDPQEVLRPAPLGSWHAARYRLGLCEVLVRVRRVDGAFRGEYGLGEGFRVDDVTDESVLRLARQLLRDVIKMYGGAQEDGAHLN